MKIYDVRGIGASLTGSFSGSFKGLFTGPLDGVAATSSYVEYTDVANKPALVSGSSQVLGFNVFATTGSNQFNGNQSITGSLTVSGQVIAQTLNVQQVTSSIVFSSGSNRFGNNSGNTHSFTGSVRVTGSLTVNGSGLIPYTGATQDVNLGVYSIATNGVLANQITVNPSGTTAAQVFLKHGSSFSLPNGFGSIGSSTGNQFRLYQVSSEGVWRGAGISLNSITPSETRVYTLPDASGTLALTSGLSAYLPLAGGTLTGALSGTSASFTGSGSFISTANTYAGGALILRQLGGTNPIYLTSVGGSFALSNGGSADHFLIASTGAATFSSSVTATAPSSGIAFQVNGRSSDNIGQILFYANNGTTLQNYIQSRPTYFSINTETNTPIYFNTNQGGGGGTAMTITGAGNVGIGTASPLQTFTLAGTQMMYNTAGDGNANTVIGSITSQVRNYGTGIATSSFASIQFATDPTSWFKGDIRFLTNGSDGTSSGGTERMRITSGGRVGIGQTAPGVALSVAGQSEVWQLGLTTVTGTAGALIGSPSANVLAFGNWSGNERMRINSSGFFKASNDGTYNDASGVYHEISASANDSDLLLLRHKGSSPYGLDMLFSAASPNNTTNWFAYFADSSALRFQVRSNGGIANYSANNVNLSDERVKKDIIPLESYWDKFKAIEIVKYKYKDQTHDDFNIGVIAQQVESVAPEFVDVDGWNTRYKIDEENNEIISEEEPLKSIYESDLHHATIKVLQEAMAKIEKLETEIDSLKNQMQ